MMMKNLLLNSVYICVAKQSSWKNADFVGVLGFLKTNKQE